jgi:hypothetical protein
MAIDNLKYEFSGTEYHVLISSHFFKVIKKPTILILLIAMLISVLLFYFQESISFWIPISIIIFAIVLYNFKTEIVFSKEIIKKKTYFAGIHIYTNYYILYKENIEIKYIKYWEGGDNVTSSYEVNYFIESKQYLLATFSKESDAQKIMEMLLEFINKK